MKTSTLRNQNILATFRRHSPWLILMMVMLLTTGFARALGADMTSLIVDRLETGGEGLGLLILVVCLVQFVNYFTKFVSATSCTALQKKLEVSLRVQILRTLQRIPFGEFEGIDPGVAQTILRKDVEGAAKYLYVVFSRIGVSVTTLCFTAWFMLRIDPWVTCVLLAIAVCLGFLNRRVLARLKELNLRAIGGSKELGQVVAYISLSTQALISIEMIFRWMGAVVGCNAAWERVNSILGRETQPELPRQRISSVETLSAEDLGFGYEEGKWIFRHRSFTVSRGEMLLITGRSGSGKSTLFRCLMGLYQPGEGRVQLDGKPVSGRELLAGVGFVPAQHTFYAGTVYENITLGDHTISRETCLQNARRLSIGDWLEEVGLEHLFLENASDLSGGQKQILSVLQAVNFDAPILILDEPFASLDAGRREKLAAFLEEYKRDHLVILTSHQEEQLDGVKVCPMG